MRKGLAKLQTFMPFAGDQPSSKPNTCYNVEYSWEQAEMIRTKGYSETKYGQKHFGGILQTVCGKFTKFITRCSFEKR